MEMSIAKETKMRDWKCNIFEPLNTESEKTNIFDKKRKSDNSTRINWNNRSNTIYKNPIVDKSFDSARRGGHFNEIFSNQFDFVNKR